MGPMTLLTAPPKGLLWVQEVNNMAKQMDRVRQMIYLGDRQKAQVWCACSCDRDLRT